MSTTTIEKKRSFTKAVIDLIGSVKSETEDLAKEPLYATMHPLVQAEFVVSFTLGTIGVYTFLIWLSSESDRIPPIWPFFGTLAIVYTIFWGSLYIELIPAMFGCLVNWVVSKLRILFKKLPKIQTVSGQRRPPSIEMHSDAYRYPKGVAARVQVLGVSSIVFSCWYTLYSGGPFQSAYSQIIVAYPLFASHIARSWKSLVLVYVATITSMLFFEWLKHYLAFDDSTQGLGWYILVTVILLVASGLVACVNRALEREK